MTGTPGKPKKAEAGSGANRGLIGLALGGGAVLLVGVIVLVAWKMREGPAPRLNDDTVALATFVSTDTYLGFPFDRQALYMKVLEDRQDNGELKRAFAAGKLSESVYRAAIQEAWLGEQLKRSEKYAVLSAGPARAKFIKELLDRKQKKSKPDKVGSRAEDEEVDEVDAVKRDPSATQMRIAQWPAPVREQLEGFLRDYDEAKEARQAARAAETNPVAERDR